MSYLIHKPHTSIGRKFAYALMLTLVIYLIVGLATSFQLTKIKSPTDNGRTINNEMSHLIKLATSIEELDRSISKLFTVGYSEDRENSFKLFSQMKGILSKLEETVVDKEMADMITDLKHHLTELQSDLESLSSKDSQANLDQNEGILRLYEGIELVRNEYSFLVSRSNDLTLVNVKNVGVLLNSVILWFIFLGSTTALIMIFIFFVLVRSVLIRIEDLRRSNEIFAMGELGHRTIVSSTDELGGLAESFNQMAAKLQQSSIELENHIAITKQALNEKENVNKLMIGRELMMMELKEEIKKLKEKYDA